MIVVVQAVIAAPSSLAGSEIEPEDKVKIWNCIVKSVEKSVEGTEIEPVIDEYKSTLYPLVHSLKTCLRDVRGNDRLEYVLICFFLFITLKLINNLHKLRLNAYLLETQSSLRTF